MSERGDTLSGLARIAGAGLIWGTIPLALRAADGSSLVKVFYRVAIAAVVMVVWQASRGSLREFAELPRRKLLDVAAQGALLALNWVLFLSALDLTDVATAELLGYTGPVFVTVLAPFVTKEKFDRRIILPLALALGGIAAILLPHMTGVRTESDAFGAALAFGSALTYSGLMLRAKKLLRGISVGALMLGEYAVASALLLPAALLLPGPSTPLAFAALAVLGVVQTALAVILFLSGLKRVRTDRAAVLMYAEPASAVVFAALFLGEPLTLTTVLGGCAVVAGGVLVARLARIGGTEEAPDVAARA